MRRCSSSSTGRRDVDLRVSVKREGRLGTTVGLSVRDNLGPLLYVRMLYDYGFKTISILALLQKKAFSSPKGFVSLYARWVDIVFRLLLRF